MHRDLVSGEDFKTGLAGRMKPVILLVLKHADLHFCVKILLDEKWLWHQCTGLEGMGPKMHPTGLYLQRKACP